mmetsp:Transcript_25478/g.35757  ORF Transcript_25478/g.35757 Transcript_25478/m.35757 type:complete len:323 (+) Transcript_25478:157-1125(+)
MGYQGADLNASGWMTSRNMSKNRDSHSSETDVLRKNKSHPYNLYHTSCSKIMREDNVYLLSGHREHTEYSFWKCFVSLLELHNDTLNIWIHIFGALFMAKLCYWTLFQSPSVSAAPFGSKFSFFLFLGACFCCYSCSAIYHWFRTYSARIYVELLMCDIIGITFQIFGCTFLLVYFEMNCFPDLQFIYLTTTIILGLATGVYVPFLVANRKTTMRTILLTLFAFTGIFVWTHHFILVGGPNEHNMMTFKYMLLAYIWIAFGMVIWKVKFPECCKPGHFDIWCSSHQIFHLTTIISPMCLYRAYQLLHDSGVANTCGQNPFFF